MLKQQIIMVSLVDNPRTCTSDRPLPSASPPLGFLRRRSMSSALGRGAGGKWAGEGGGVPCFYPSLPHADSQRRCICEGPEALGARETEREILTASRRERVGTNGFITQVPQFPMVEFIQENAATCGETYGICGKICAPKQNMATCRGFVATKKKCLSWPRLEASKEWPGPHRTPPPPPWPGPLEWLRPISVLRF